MASIMEGPLSKWTNVMKGWQYRWFVLDYNAGLLSYYTVSPRGPRPRVSRASLSLGRGGPGFWGAGLRLLGWGCRHTRGFPRRGGFYARIANEGEGDAGAANKQVVAV